MSFFSFMSQNIRWLLGGFLLTFFSSFGQTFFISLSGGAIRQEYDLSNGEFGLTYMLATLGSALTLPFLGKIVDHISVSKTVLLTIPALAAATLVMGLSKSVVVLVIVLYFLRLFGQGMMTHISLTAMGKWYCLQRGRAVSIAVVGHQAGEAFLPIVYSFALVMFTWRETWTMSSLFLMLIALPTIYFLMKVERMPSDSVDGETNTLARKNWTRKEVLADRYFWALLIAVLAPAFIGTTLFFHQDHLIDLRGWDKLEFAYSFSVMAISTFVFALIAGHLVDRFSAVSILPSFLLPLGAACFAMGTIEDISGSYISMGLLGISYGLSSTLFGALWPEIYGTKYLGAIRSIIIAMMVFGTAIGPGITGYLIDLNVAYPAQIHVMGLYCLAASVVMLFVSRKIKARLQADS
jgi:sugar phosphate permease